MRRGLLGGTFDPPHLAHLVIAEAAFRQLEVEVVSFLPAGSPWQKSDQQVTDAAHRWGMTVAAVSDVSYFDADDREVCRPGLTFTIDSLVELDGDDLTLILGADTALGVASWHRADEVLERARIAVAYRPGVDRERVEAVLGDRMVWLEAPALNISGTELRKRARSGGSLRFLVREPVWEYVNEHRLYR